MAEDDVLQSRKSSVDMALLFLKLFSVDEPELSAGVIATRLGVANSTVHRLATTLIAEGVLTKDPRTNLYRLGTSILGLTQVIMNHSKLYATAQVHLEMLVKQCNETAQVGLLRNLEILYLNKVESTRVVAIQPLAGDRTGLHCTALGQVLLAYQTPMTLEVIRKLSLPRYTSRTVTNGEALMNLIHRIREQGYAVSEDQQHEGITSIAAPIRSGKGDVIAAVSLTGRTQRMRDAGPSQRRALIHAAGEISSAMSRT